MVSTQWLFAYLTHQRGIRLIIGRATPRVGSQAAALLRGAQPPVAKPG